jgi:hypothetical protein
MSETVRALGRLAGGVLVLSLAACGGGGGGGPTTPTATPVPTPTPPAVVSQGAGLPLAAGYAGLVNVTTARTGTLDVTVDWTYPANDVDVLLTRGACTFDQLIALQCTILAFSDSTTAKPEKIHAESAAAGTYSLFVENTGPGDESVSFQVVLTPTTAAAAPPSASSRGVSAMPLGHKRALRGVVELR